MSDVKPAGWKSREMKMVHTYLRREYSLLPKVVRGVAAGDQASAEFVADHIQFISVTLEEHHGGEDKHIWPRLLVRCPEDLAPVVHLMEHHHEGIAGALGELPAALATWRGTADPKRGEAIAGAVDGLAAALFEHLKAEEDRVLPLIEEHITADEWNAMVSQGAANIPPEKGPVLFGMVMYEGDPEAVKDALENIPQDVRAGIREAAPKAYAAYAERLYGTQTPPRIGLLREYPSGIDVDDASDSTHIGRPHT